MTTERLTFEVDIVRGGDARVVSVNGEVLPEFLPVGVDRAFPVRRAIDVILVPERVFRSKKKPEVHPAHIMITMDSRGSMTTTFPLVSVSAPYFAAWLDRLGIPWTDDLRKAHEAATKKGEEA